MKKLLYRFNWCMFLIFIIAMCSLDNPSWTATIIMVISGLALASGAYILEQVKLHEEAMKDYEC